MSQTQETNRRKLQLGRFVIGMLLSSIGISTILLVGINLVHISRVRNEFALPIVGGSVVAGIMLLGGGFGLMATSAAGFDEEEFDRLMASGPARAVEVSNSTERFLADEGTANRVDDSVIDGLSQVDSCGNPGSGIAELARQPGRNAV